MALVFKTGTRVNQTTTMLIKIVLHTIQSLDTTAHHGNGVTLLVFPAVITFAKNWPRELTIFFILGEIYF